MATEPKEHYSVFLVRNTATGKYKGKPSKYGRNGQPAIYWSESIAKSQCKTGEEVIERFFSEPVEF